MDVQVIFHASSGRFAKIPADIEALGFHRDLKQPLRVNTQAPQVENLVFGDLRHFANFAARNGHEMPSGVGVFVHQKKSGWSPRHNEVCGVITRRSRLGKEINPAAVLGLKVLNPPWCPKGLDGGFWKLRVHAARMNPASQRGK